MAEGPDLDDQELVNAPGVCKMMGGRSMMWLHRRLNDPDPKRRLDKPFVIANRRYWTRGYMRRWRDAQLANETKPPQLDDDALSRLRQGQDEARLRRNRREVVE
jgi:hypothetical protein